MATLITGVGAAFVQSVFPVLLIGSLGYVVGRARSLDLAPITSLAVLVFMPAIIFDSLAPITSLAVLVFMPAIIFDSLARAALPPDVLLQLVLHVVLQMAGIWLLTVLVARLIGWQGPARGALLLSTLFSNSGNIGLPLAYFAFGQEGFAIAGGWFAIMAIGSSTIAPYLAARALVGIRAAIARVVRQPAIYAVVAGLAVNLSGWPLPGPVAKASELLAGGSVAMMLLLVGLQLARLSMREEVAGAVLGTSIRLVAVPFIAWAAGKLVGLQGTALAVAVLQASTPVAVTSALWALEFNARPALVSATVVLSTLASVVTLTVLLAVLTSGS